MRFNCCYFLPILFHLCFSFEMELHCAICLILSKPFNRFQFQEKVDLIKNGAPKPELPELHSTHADKNRTFVRSFNRNQYDSNSWMCGCSQKSRLFCWPCLLFSTSKTIWNNDGVHNLNTLSQVQKKHVVTIHHLQACLALENFNSSGTGSNRIEMLLDVQMKNSIIQHIMKK